MNDTEETNRISLEFKVLINGNDIADVADVISITAHKQFCKISTAEVVLHYGSLLDDDFIDDKNQDISIGNELEIYADEGELCVFKGVVVKKSISLSNKKSLLTLTAKNKAYKMALNRYNHVFSEMKDSEMIEELINKYGLNCEVESTSYKNETVTQYNCSDWDFVNIKAESNALLVFTDDDKIMVKKPKVKSAKFEINGYESIVDFDAQLDGRTAFSEYKATLWNYNGQEKKEVEQKNASSDFRQGSQQTTQLADKLENDTFTMNINSCFVDDDIVVEKVNAAIMRNNLSRIIGKARLFGVSDVKPGETVKFSGLGGSFNGDAYVTEVEFEFEKGAWSTIIGFGMEETSYYWSYDDINAAPAAELSPAAHGLQVAKVVALEGDPADDFRIKVSLPCFDGENAEIWARYATANAGDKRGGFCFPEIDDEVVMGFVDQNPNNPIVLGSLYSNKMASPQALSDDNNLKGIYLKSGIKLEINEEDKIIIVETPGNNKMVLNDKDGKFEIGDANGNQIVMDSQGMVIKSAGKISIEATSDMELKGVNLTSEASASYKASGNANAEVSSSGIMVVKGALVQIN
ncbi:type VI secretion system tip protein VgrG [Bacteroides heparinolyticus]|uniref:type VI secretion system tip protein VgrG n=2 Tax=Prevotella heparinolytica TaxID=28113 RepID=UPI0035A0ED29